MKTPFNSILVLRTKGLNKNKTFGRFDHLKCKPNSLWTLESIMTWGIYDKKGYVCMDLKAISNSIRVFL